MELFFPLFILHIRVLLRLCIFRRCLLDDSNLLGPQEDAVFLAMRFFKASNIFTMKVGLDINITVNKKNLDSLGLQRSVAFAGLRAWH